MRWALRALAAIAALVVVAGVAAVALLPRLVDRPEVRARIEAGVREATGREISYQSLRAGFLPPAIEVVRPVLSGETAGAPPAFEAERISLRLALLPLLSRTIVIESLRVDGPRVNVVRDEPASGASGARREPASPARAGDGRAPGAAAGSPESPAGTPPASNEKPGGAGAPAAEPASSTSAMTELGIRAIDVDDATIRIEDRTVSPPVVVVLTDGEAHARATDPQTPIRFDTTMRVESGGTITAQGTATTSGAIDAEATLDGVEAAPLAGYLGAGRSGGDARALAGRLGGTVRAQGPIARPEKVEAKLRFDDATIDLESVRLRGRLAVSANLSGASGALGGPFEIDATEAELAYGGVFRKPPGTPATTSGTLRARPAGGFEVGDLRVKIKNFEAHGSARSAPGSEVVLAAPPFDLAGWQALLPSLGGRALAGRLGLDLRASKLDSAPVATLAATGRDIDAHALSERISGPLRFDARLTAPLAASKPIAEVVSGTLDFVLGPGTFQGVSALRDTIQRSGPLVEAAVAAGRAFGGRDVQRMYDDRFERIAGDLVLGSGIARFDPIEAVYRDYRVDLRGSVRLADRALDARGAIAFADARGAGAMRGQTLPISHIGGTLDRPRIELSPQDIASIAASAGGTALERKLGPVLDRLRDATGGGKRPLGALERLFGGKKRD